VEVCVDAVEFVAVAVAVAAVAESVAAVEVVEAAAGGGGADDDGVGLEVELVAEVSVVILAEVVLGMPERQRASPPQFP
jgi:hypothetical protein